MTEQSGAWGKVQMGALCGEAGALFNVRLIAYSERSREVWWFICPTRSGFILIDQTRTDAQVLDQPSMTKKWSQRFWYQNLIITSLDFIKVTTFFSWTVLASLGNFEKLSFYSENGIARLILRQLRGSELWPVTSCARVSWRARPSYG